MLKTVGIIMLYSCLATLSIAQSSGNNAIADHADNIANVVLETAYLDRLAKTNPFSLDRWTYMSKHGWELKNYPLAKGEPPYPVLDADLWNGYNVLELELTGKISRHPDYLTYYRLGTTNTILILHSSSEITAKMNESRNFAHPQKPSK